MTVGRGVLVGVGVTVGRGVRVCVGVTVGRGVRVGAAVMVAAGTVVRVGVAVGVAVGRGVWVGAGVVVGRGVLVGVAVSTRRGARVARGVAVPSADMRGVGVAVTVGLCRCATAGGVVVGVWRWLRGGVAVMVARGVRVGPAAVGATVFSGNTVPCMVLSGVPLTTGVVSVPAGVPLVAGSGACAPTKGRPLHDARRSARAARPNTAGARSNTGFSSRTALYLRVLSPSQEEYRRDARTMTCVQAYGTRTYRHRNPGGAQGE